MINPFKEINWSPNNTDIKDFGRSLIIGGVILLTGISLYRTFFPVTGNGIKLVQMLFSLIIILGFMAQLLPAISKPVYFVWFFIGACMGTVVSNLLFLVFYYLFFTPISFVVKLNGRDPLKIKAKNCNSNWVDKPETHDAKRYFRQY